MEHAVLNVPEGTNRLPAQKYPSERSRRLAPEMILIRPALEQIPFKERKAPGARLPKSSPLLPRGDRIGEHSRLVPDLITLNRKSIELVPLLVDELREGVVP